jgi:hypothetical protein
MIEKDFEAKQSVHIYLLLIRLLDSCRLLRSSVAIMLV